MGASEDGAIIGEEVRGRHGARVEGVGGVGLAIKLAKEGVDVDVEEIGGGRASLREASGAREGGKATAVDDKASSGTVSGEGPNHCTPLRRGAAGCQSSIDEGWRRRVIGSGKVEEDGVPLPSPSRLGINADNVGQAGETTTEAGLSWVKPSLVAFGGAVPSQGTVDEDLEQSAKHDREGDG